MAAKGNSLASSFLYKVEVEEEADSKHLIPYLQLNICRHLCDEFVDLWICGCGSRLGVIMARDAALARGKVGASVKL